MDTYESWLKLSALERDKIILEWDAYLREGFKFVLMAAGRFAFSLSFPILDVRVATGHNGVWQILAFVSDLGTIPDVERVSKFEGFPVLWFDMGNIQKIAGDPGDSSPPSSIFKIPG